MRVGRFQITASILRQIMHLPENARIIDVQNARFMGDEMDVEIVCLSPDFDDVPDGETPPVRRPYYRSGADHKPEFLELRD